MKEENNILDNFKGQNPFTVPDGYMEGLTGHIMSQLPERSDVGTIKTISPAQRVRPWLYLAAVFAGIGLFLKLIVGSDFQENNNSSDSLLVQSGMTNQNLSISSSVEDQEYQEYIENKYANYALEGELRYSE